jgi:hypothetical protein
VTNASAISNGLNQVALPRSTTNKFYRLKYP